MTVKAENERLELLARVEIAMRLRAMDQSLVWMEFWEDDVRKMLVDYAKSENIGKSRMYRIARSFLAACKNGDELMRKFGPKRRTE